MSRRPANSYLRSQWRKQHDDCSSSSSYPLQSPVDDQNPYHYDVRDDGKGYFQHHAYDDDGEDRDKIKQTNFNNGNDGKCMSEVSESNSETHCASLNRVSVGNHREAISSLTHMDSSLSSSVHYGEGNDQKITDEFDPFLLPLPLPSTNSTTNSINANVSVPLSRGDKYLTERESQMVIGDVSSIGHECVNIKKENSNNMSEWQMKHIEHEHDHSQLQSSAARPKSLFPSQQLTVTPCPEFSISPADSLSKASSSENMAESSIPHPPPHSPSLSVNYNGDMCTGTSLGHSGHMTGTLAISPSFTSLQGSSLASSINDLTIEAEQLERAIRHNDTRFVRRMLELHHRKLPSNSHGSVFEKSSHGSRHSHCGVIQESDKTQRGHIDRVHSIERRESGSTEEPGADSQLIFTNALHLAIESNSYDAAVILLKYGIDPNEAGVTPYSDTWRRSSYNSDESGNVHEKTTTDRLTINNLNLINSSSREPLIRSPSMRSAYSPNLLSPLAGPSLNNNTGGSGAGGTNNCGAYHSIYFAVNSSPSSMNSELSSIGRFSTPTKLLRLRSDLSPNHRVVHISEDGSAINYEDEYTRENLYSLPPIFLAVTLNNALILRELIKYGAYVNINDRHGVSPLHLTLCQEHVSRSCLLLLIQSGAKILYKNKQGLAPYQLAYDNVDEIVELQKSIIENAFAQIVPQQSTNSYSNNYNSSVASFPRVYSFGNDDNNVSGTGLGAVPTVPVISSISANVKSVAASGIIKKFQQRGKEKSKKDVYICLDNASRISPDGPTNTSFQDSTQSEVNSKDSIGGCKRSIAGDSIAPSCMGPDDDIPISPPHASHTSQIRQEYNNVNGSASRFLGRRKSGDDNTNTAFSFIKIGKFGTKSNQNQHHNNHGMYANEKNELNLSNRIENSMQMLIKMGSNLECVPFILLSLQKNLSSIIAFSESTAGHKMHVPLTSLLNKLLQTIVEEICEVESKTQMGMVTAPTVNKKKRERKVLDTQTKEQLASQLCRLLRSAILCLREGQALQYTALLLVNKIIDTCIVYGVAQYQCICVETNASGGVSSSKSNINNNRECKSSKTNVTVSSNRKLASSKTTKSTVTAQHSSSLKENQKLEINAGNNKQEKTFIGNEMANVTAIGTGGREGKTLWSKCMKNKVNITNSNTSVNSQSQGKHHDVKRESSTAEDTNVINKTSLLTILTVEGVDLILNVLNNAITLHKRVSGSKQNCTPSHRWRQCTYHCLQILSARAILYVSQCDEAQKKLMREGPLKVLITGMDSTHDPQLICLTLQLVANLALNPANHATLIEAELADSLMQLILPSDEWYYTNHSTKYAKYVKHHAARIMVYLGLDKRLRNKVYLFDLLEESQPQQTPVFDSDEDNYIIRTSLTPIGIHAPINNKLIGISVEGMIFDMLKQIERKIIRGDDNESNDPLCDESQYFYGTDGDCQSTIPPSIHVDLASGVGTESLNMPNTFFYLSAFPTVLKPLIIFRLLQHSLFGCIQFWTLPSGAVSARSSLASVGGSIENRSRASSMSNANVEIDNSLRSRRNVNLTINCSTVSLSPARVDIERRTSMKGFVDTRVIIQTSIPITSVTLTMAPRNQQQSQLQPQPLPYQYQRKSMVEHIMQRDSDSKDNTPVTSPGQHKKPFLFSSLRRKRLSRSIDASSPPINTPEKNEVDIMAFQRELQNLPKSDVSPGPASRVQMSGLAQYSSAIASYIREALERSISPAFSRPRSCSVPRVTFDDSTSSLLQLPVTQKAQTSQGSPLIRSATTEGPYTVGNNVSQATNLGRSPASLSPNNLGMATTAAVTSESPLSGSGTGRSGSACHAVNDQIMPYAHRAILRLIHDWARLCPNDLKQNKTILRELKDFLNRISMFGEQYQWFAEEIRVIADIQDTDPGDENQSDDAAADEEYQMLRQLVLSGELPCSKEEAAVLAGIQLRIEETCPDSKTKNNNLSTVSTVPQTLTARQNITTGEKLRPICEDVKETSPIEVDRIGHPIGHLTMAALPFSEIEQSEESTEISEGTHGTSSLARGSFVTSVSDVTKRTTSILCHWVTSNWANRGTQSSTAINLRECLPPLYHNAKNMGKTIKEQKRKLFHSSVYESEVQLKKLYIQTCKRLPSYGCRIFQVKELLRGKTKRRTTRLLGIGAERIVLLDSKTLTPAKCQPTNNLQQWRTGGGRSHDRLVLEFRGTKWSFITPSQGLLREIGTVLWEIMQDLDARFLDEHLITSRDELENECRRIYRHGFGFDRIMHFREELQRLESHLHFPEEVAFRLSEVEYELFYGVSPVHYIRQVTINLNGEQNLSSNANATPSENALTVRELVERFNEVSSWITHLIITQPTHEMRKAVLSCIMRVVQMCWNLGNFNSAVEILAGLKSEKLKPFWLSICEKDRPVLVETLSKALLSMSEPSPEYKEVVRRALDVPHSKVIPFFGTFLRDLRCILQGMPSLVVLPFEMQTDDVKLYFISDYHGEDHYMSRIGVGGIMNIEKMHKTHQVLDNIHAFHLHAQRRQQLLADSNQNSPSSSNCQQQSSTIASSVPSTKIKGTNYENNGLYEISLESYCPIQPFVNSHGVSFVPINASTFDLHTLQVMHHGTTVIHYEEDTLRSSIVYLQLEQSNSILVWCKPFWSSAIKTSAGTPQDYSLSHNIEESVLPGIMSKYECRDAAITGLDEGYIDLLNVKDIVIGQSNADLVTIARRHGLSDNELSDSRDCTVQLLFGTNLSDNRSAEFIAPKMTAKIWTDGLKALVKLIQQQRQLTDQRISWLKERYLQLYYEDSSCTGPTPAEAIKVFGGRKWTLDAMGSSCQSSTLDLSFSKHTSTFGVGVAKMRKKKSSLSLVAIRDYSPKSQSIANYENDHGTKGHPSPTIKLKKSSVQSIPHIKTQSDQSPDVRVYTRTDSPNSSSGHSCSSSDNINRKSVTGSPPVHTSSLTYHYREKFRRNKISENDISNKHCPKAAITHSSQMDFVEFMELFRSFLIRLRRDIKDFFEQIASKGDIHSFNEQESSETTETVVSPSSSQSGSNTDKMLLGLLTRNTPFDRSEENHQRTRICDAIAAASIVANCAGVDTLKTLLLNANDFQSFLITYQGENPSLEHVKSIIQMHEPDPSNRKRNCLSFEGFARYLMDKDNFAYEPEMMEINEDDMNEPLSHYYMASSHNTYLTGHQLKGESSVELYSQVLSTGCRCVELDCWDGDDGYPMIYHGHTLTSKIPFKKVIETINDKAFVASPYPVILSIENHCSLQQQAKMAQMFITIFGEKLVTKFLFESDYTDDPQLPSPNQLKYRILIKNKKLRAPLTPALTMKTRASTLAKSTSGRTNSLISTASTGSLNEEEDDEYDDEDEDEEGLEDSLPSTATNADSGLPQHTVGELQVVTKTPALRTESLSSQEYGSTYGDHRISKGLGFSSPGPGSRPRSQNEEHGYEIESTGPFHHNKVVRKSSSQIAPELSDLIIYCQAIKFRGFVTAACSPTNTAFPQSAKKIARKNTILGPGNAMTTQSSICDTKLGIIESRELMSPSPIASVPISSNIPSNKRPTVSAPCYQVSSINENTAKKLCRKNPLSLIAHTENQVMRTYPARMRIDSSNFNPVIFWAFGMQSVALNYQTVDSALHINTAMFEQNGHCGLVLKPAVMRNKSHMMYGRFNPWDKEFDGLHAINLTITVISGQYVCPNTNIGSPQVEVEIIGIPVDSGRQRTKLVQRNSLNPIWNDTFLFRVTFSDLAFIRFAVTDMGTNHVTAQRVIPFNCLKRGYRHLRLRNPQNQSLPLSTLFIYSSWEEEGIEMSIGQCEDPSNGGVQLRNKKMRQKITSSVDLTRLDSKEIIGSAPVRRRMFFLVVYGVVPEEPSTILKITQECSAYDVIGQALAKANKPNENPADYVLIEEVHRGWEKKHLVDRNAQTQRILDPDERPLEAQGLWKGNGRFVMKKLADDPSTRAWMTTIRTAYNQKERQKRQESDLTSGNELNSAWIEDHADTFLVCIFNVSPDQPYTILKAPASSTAQDIIAQALLKARRMEDPRNFVIVEELEYYYDTNTDASSGNKSKGKLSGNWRRVLHDDENIYLAQAEWKNKGKFELKNRDDITTADMTSITQSVSKLTRAKGSLKKLSNLRGSTKKNRSKISRDDGQSHFSASNSSRESYGSRDSSRQVHSEGEMPSDSEDKKIVTSIAKLKKLSFRRLKVWR